MATLYLVKLHRRTEDIKTNGVEINHAINYDLDNMLDELNEEYGTQSDDAEFDSSGLLLSLTSYDAIQRSNLKDEVMNFWRTNKEQFPTIYRLACIIHAIPAGQCFEERNFSSFAYIRNARRAKLSPTNVKNILTVRLNKEIFYERKQTEINSILSGKKVD